MAALPYMQLYVSDYLADTMHLTTEEHGAYLLLIFNYWQTGKAIPKERLARIARLSNDRWILVEASLNEMFNDTGSHWEHLRIKADLVIANDAQEQRSKAGKASAEARKRKKRESEKALNKPPLTTVPTTVATKDVIRCNENATNKEKIREDNNIKDIVRFSEFWEQYPPDRRRDKKGCLKKWKDKKLDQSIDSILTDIKNRKTSHKDWLGGFIPLTTTYINQEQWDDGWQPVSHKPNEPQVSRMTGEAF